MKTLEELVNLKINGIKMIVDRDGAIGWSSDWAGTMRLARAGFLIRKVVGRDRLTGSFDRVFVKKAAQ